MTKFRMRSDMTVRESSAQIEQQAAMWAARLDARVLTAAETADLDAWLAGDSRRLGAWAMARAALARVELAQPTQGDAPHEDAPVATRRSAFDRRTLLRGAGLEGLQVFAFLPAHSVQRNARSEQFNVCGQ